MRRSKNDDTPTSSSESPTEGDSFILKESTCKKSKNASISSESSSSDSEKLKKKKTKKGKSTKESSKLDTDLENQLIDEFNKLSTNTSVSEKIALEVPTFDCFIKHFREKGFKKIVTMIGAGVSTSAGVPDFRSTETGLYNKLAKYDLPYPQAIFELEYFMKHPGIFYDIAKRLLPKDFRATYSHWFIRLLEVKGLLLRHYTQNVDGLDRKVGITDERLVEAHGSFATSHCTKCHRSYSFEWLSQELNSLKIPTCIICNSLVKPDIVFFNENLPPKFFENLPNDFKKADLLLIMGSSLKVEPFASLVKRVDRTCPRVIINDQETGDRVGIIYDPRYNTRDVFIKEKCDDGCKKIISSLGWEEDMIELMSQTP